MTHPTDDAAFWFGQNITMIQHEVGLINDDATFAEFLDLTVEALADIKAGGCSDLRVMGDIAARVGWGIDWLIGHGLAEDLLYIVPNGVGFWHHNRAGWEARLAQRIAAPREERCCVDPCQCGGCED